MEVPPGREPRYFWITEKQEVVVWSEGGELRAFASICPHMGGQLCPRPEEGTLRCSWHPLAFDAKTGRSDHKKYKAIREFSARMEGKDLVLSD